VKTQETGQIIKQKIFNCRYSLKSLISLAIYLRIVLKGKNNALGLPALVPTLEVHTRDALLNVSSAKGLWIHLNAIIEVLIERFGIIFRWVAIGFRKSCSASQKTKSD